MTSREIRTSFLDFFRSKSHTIVPSSSLLPDSPNLLFTNAGMNQFVPIFVGERTPDVDRWPGAIPASPLRAADTQKCIRAGGKHNDLEDVGLDTYHHTFFEMLGNWSFGDYFKKEAISWAWELLVETWGFPVERLYATVYAPAKGDPSEFDQEAFDLWADLFSKAGLDPKSHIVEGTRKDNFWMMGETGPCGPCSEVHIDLTPEGRTGGSLVNAGDGRCIEIWNLVFIQFNANPDGSFVALPSRHVDTGMGFERVASVIQGTRGFRDFGSGTISNYETDIFRPLFDRIEELSSRKYGSSLPAPGSTKWSKQERDDVAFRVIADHARTLAFSIGDGIQPGNSDRSYVLRRILRRAVRYGRTIGLEKPFFHQLPAVLAETMGDVFPEVRQRLSQIEETLRTEEESFNRTLDKGIALFEEEAARLEKEKSSKVKAKGKPLLSGAFAFRLYDEQGFPLDLTEVMARERGLEVDAAGFEKLMTEQRDRARRAQKKEVISVSTVAAPPTRFVGYTDVAAEAKLLQIVEVNGRRAAVLDCSPFYADMGGQVGDTGILSQEKQEYPIVDTRKAGEVWLHFLGGENIPREGEVCEVAIHLERRRAIERHHTVTHLLHWALHEVVGREVSQKGSSVSEAKLTFDFNAAPLTPEQVETVERLVNQRIIDNAAVSACEVPFEEVRGRADIMQFFGEKYGHVVRVVQIGGRAGMLDGYSMELCGGTHTRATGEIGLFRIQGEGAVAAGVRRIEAVAGMVAADVARAETLRLQNLAGRLGTPLGDLEKRIEALQLQQKELERAMRAVEEKQ
ncbi:MAG: alanine--tRNA ligase, partial [Verrucomicrobiia bacterium]